jgi:hypothetical protein
MMRARLLACLLLFCPAAAHAQVPAITGEYTVEGTAGGGAYRGQAAIAPDGDVFVVVWQIGGSRYQGTGLLRDGKFAVTYASRGRPALAFYDVQPDGTLAGRWTEFGSKTVFTEKLVPKGRL